MEANKEIKLFYWDESPNMGDMYNECLCKELFGVTPISTSPGECEAAFCGSLLDDFLYQKPFPIFFPTSEQDKKTIVHIWGAGFIADKWKCAIRYRKLLPETYYRKVEVHAVRGVLSKKRLEKIIKTNLENIPLADPGLLASHFVKNNEKIYDVGIIPHHIEKDLQIFEKLKELGKVTFIDVEKDPITCISQIAQCKCVLSSSLHGLIFADSLGIPNARLIASNRLKGGNYKFQDYYSSYGDVKTKVYDIRKEVQISLDEVMTEYKIEKQLVEQKKEQLIESFPKCFLR